MKNKTQKIKNIFIKNMFISAVIQILVLGMLIVLAKNIYRHYQINSITGDLLVNDDYTLKEIVSYELTNNKYALDLELHNLADMQKLDSVNFFINPIKFNKLDVCQRLNKGFLLCHDNSENYWGTSPVRINNKILGYILAKKKYDSVFSLNMINDLFLILLTVIGGLLLNFIFLFYLMRRKIELNTEHLLRFFSNPSTENASYNNINIDEYKNIAQKFYDEKLKSTKLEKEQAYYLAKKDIAAQVAHDIRSPLAALNVLIKQTQNIPENQRIMIRNAAQQINKIANNLLEKYRNEKNESNVHNPEIISLLLDTVVSEKLAQYTDERIKIDFDVHPDSQGVFCNVVAADFKRVMSNLINNAVEAMDNKGNVSVKLSHQENLVKIAIADNGTGMPQALIQKIMSGEVVSSKKSGHGIGLSTAKTMIESWGGNLNITSEPGRGTIIEINLPLIEPAEWFADKLHFKQNSTVIILDDDQSIHDVWESRFDTEIPHAKLHRTHYYSPEEVLKTEVDQRAVYLCDYELLGYSLTGLDVIEKLNLKNAVLVASRYDEPDVRARCQKIGIKILPKSYAIYIPLIVQEDHILSTSTVTKEAISLDQKDQLKPDLILIDDNKTLTDAWKLSAEFEDKHIVIFNSIGEAESDIYNYSDESVIYVDSDLGENIKGEAYAKTLYDKGYKNLYLATGYEASQFNLNELYWIKKIVGKDPQFEDI